MCWRQSVLKKTWIALKSFGETQHTVLHLRVLYPDEDSSTLAARLAKQLGRQITPEAARQQLRRARLKFSQLLIEELARSLNDPSPEAIEEELSELGLMNHVRDFLPADWRETGQLSY